MAVELCREERSMHVSEYRWHARVLGSQPQSPELLGHLMRWLSQPVKRGGAQITPSQALQLYTVH